MGRVRIAFIAGVAALYPRLNLSVVCSVTVFPSDELSAKGSILRVSRGE